MVFAVKECGLCRERNYSVQQQQKKREYLRKAMRSAETLLDDIVPSFDRSASA